MSFKRCNKYACVRVIGLLMLGVFACVKGPIYARESKDPEADRRAINAVLVAQQEAWNRGDVDAFLTGYWHSEELTFSGSGGISRGWNEVLARYKKTYPDRAAMGYAGFFRAGISFSRPRQRTGSGTLAPEAGRRDG